jgi:photosystem II stability/assembly factor-like uncharacterized protein
MIKPSGNKNCITVLDDNNIWIGGYNGKIYFYDGNSWTTINLDYGSIMGIYVVNENCIFAFDSQGKLIFNNGIGWIELYDFDYSSFKSVFAFSEDDIWIGGGHNLFHYNGTAWLEVINENDYYVNDINGLSSDDVWFACNDGIILHWDGSGVSEQSSATKQSLLGIKMIDSNTGFAVGNRGIILKYNK